MSLSVSDKVMLDVSTWCNGLRLGCEFNLLFELFWITYLILNININNKMVIILNITIYFFESTQTCQFFMQSYFSLEV